MPETYQALDCFWQTAGKKAREGGRQEAASILRVFGVNPEQQGKVPPDRAADRVGLGAASLTWGKGEQDTNHRLTNRTGTPEESSIRCPNRQAYSHGPEQETTQMPIAGTAGDQAEAATSSHTQHRGVLPCAGQLRCSDLDVGCTHVVSL